MKKPKIKENPALDSFSNAMKHIFFKCYVGLRVIHKPTRKVVVKVTILSIDNVDICGIWSRNLGSDEWVLLTYVFPKDLKDIINDMVKRMGDDAQIQYYIPKGLINQEKVVI